MEIEEDKDFYSDIETVNTHELCATIIPFNTKKKGFRELTGRKLLQYVHTKKDNLVEGKNSIKNKDNRGIRKIILIWTLDFTYKVHPAVKFSFSLF